VVAQNGPSVLTARVTALHAGGFTFGKEVVPQPLGLKKPLHLILKVIHNGSESVSWGREGVVGQRNGGWWKGMCVHIRLERWIALSQF